MRASALFIAIAVLGANSLAIAQAPGAPPSEQGGTTNSQPPAAPDDPDQRIRCRQIAITGSLVRRERVCKTVAEWRRLRILASENARDIADHSRTRPAGN